MGSSFSSLARDRRRERRDVDRGFGKRRKTGAHDRRFDGRQIALNVDHDIVDAVGVDRAQRLENAVGPGRVIRTGHDRLAAGRGDRLDDARIVRRHPDRPDIRLHRPAPDMDDHRLAVNVGERLSRQASRVHARGDEDDGIGHQFRLSQIRGRGAYTCCQGARKAANQREQNKAPQASPNSLQLTKVPLANGPRECEPGRAFGARGGVVRHAAHRLQQSRLVAANPQGSRLRAADRRPQPRPPRRQAEPEDAAARAARQGRRHEGRKRRQGLRDLPQFQGRRRGQDRAAIFGASSAARSRRSRASPIPTRSKAIGGDWTYEKLNAWITDPKAMAAGTKMAFPGEKDAQKRADILAYLQTLSDKPVPSPEIGAGTRLGEVPVEAAGQPRVRRATAKASLAS